MLQTGVYLLLESSINKLLATDAATLAALEKLDGKVFEFIVTDAPIQLFILPNAQGVQIQQHYPYPADTSLKGTLNHFRLLVTSQDKSSQFFGNGISIQGDSQLAAKLQRILADTLIDWQGLIAKYSTETIAHQFISLAKMASTQGQLTQQSVSMNIAEYLQEELQTLPPRAQVDGFISDIDQLSERVERLEARISQLASNS